MVPSHAAIVEIVASAPAWLPGRLVVEIAPHQVEVVSAMATGAGFPDVDVAPDLLGRFRVLIARI